MYDLFKKNFDVFDTVLGFDYPRNFYFNCKVKDMMPSKWEKTEDGYKCTCRTVGISPDDVKVVLDEDHITVSGETEMDGYKYNTHYVLPISKDVVSNINKVKYKTQNGITIIYIDIERPAIKKIAVEKI